MSETGTEVQMPDNQAEIDQAAEAKEREARERDHKKIEQMQALGRHILVLDESKEQQDSVVASCEAELKIQREKGRVIQKERDDAATQLANIAAGKFSELLPIADPAVQASKAAVMPGIDTTDPATWRSVKLSDLKVPKPLTAKKLEILEGHHPSIKTLGDFQDWAKLKGDFWAKDIKGFGDGAKKIMEDLLERFFRDNGSTAKPAQVAPPAVEATAVQEAAPEAMPTAEPAAEPDIAPDLQWKPTGVEGEQVAAGYAPAGQEAPEYTITTVNGQYYVAGSPGLFTEESVPPASASMSKAEWFCDEHNSKRFEWIRQAAKGERDLTDDEVAENLGMQGKLGDNDYRLMRAAATNNGIFADLPGDMQKRLYDLNLIEPDDAGEAALTQLGRALLGEQSAFDAELVKFNKLDEPIGGTSAPIPATEPFESSNAANGSTPAATVKRGRGRPRKNPVPQNVLAVAGVGV